MKSGYYDIDGCLVVPKGKPQKRKISYKTIINRKMKSYIIELELKLPNEFKGSINNYNHLNSGGYGNIDENEYNFF